MNIKLISRLSRVWKNLFTASVDGSDGDDGQQDDGDAGDGDDGQQDDGDAGDGDQDDGSDDLQQDDEPAPAPKPMSRAQARILKLNEEREAERQRAERAERRAAELEAERQQRQAGPTPDQQLWQQEEEVLRNPNASEDEKWRIQANRALRHSQQASMQARLEAEDLRDEAKFNLQAAKNPQLFDQYRERVEAELKALRSKGQNAPRAEILKYLVGQDLLERGASKPKTPAKTVPRGKTPGVSQAQASAKGGASEREKREARLRDIPI